MQTKATYCVIRKMNNKEAANNLNEDNTCGNELLQQSDMLRKYLLIQSAAKKSIHETFMELHGRISMEDHDAHETDDPSLLCQSNLQTLLPTDTDAEEKPYSCEFCGKTYSKIYMVRKHSLTHLKQKTHLCETCGKAFSAKYDLHRHRATHSNLKPYICKICNRAFPCKYYLKAHSFAHSNQRSFACVICGKGFKRKRNLQRHSLSHTEEKPYGCDFCNKSYKSNQSLKKHLLIHWKEKHHVRNFQ